jgi:DNA-binding LacI/PurR family transcriptional regulator
MKTNKNSATIRDVARLAGVSVATISRYLNNGSLLSHETSALVRAAMAELKYVPHPIARNLATQRTNTIGLVINDIQGEFFTPLLDGVIDTTESYNYNLLIFTSKRSGHHDRLLLGPIYTDGLLVFLDSLGENDLRELHQAGHPIVLIHQSAPSGLDIPVVTIENEGASYRIVSHLIEQHDRKKIVFLQGPQDNEDSYWREIGYRDALKDHGLEFDEMLISRGDFDRYVAHKSIQTLIQTGVEFDAVFSGDDDAAIGVLRALSEAGISVPQQVSVAGFDDQRLASFLNPPLTTAHAPTDRVGITATQQLIHLIRKEPTEPVLLLPTDLVIRSSCGCQNQLSPQDTGPVIG